MLSRFIKETTGSDPKTKKTHEDYPLQNGFIGEIAL
jgi:hypothetical protein